MNLPTQYELATLAATQTGTPYQRVSFALDLWMAAGEELDRKRNLDSKISEVSKRLEELTPGDRISQDQFLSAAFTKAGRPTARPEDRVAELRNWLRHMIPFHREMNRDYGFPDGSELSPEELERQVSVTMERIRQNGYPRDCVLPQIDGFSAWLKQQSVERRTLRGKRGKEAQIKALEDKKSPESPQAEANPPQAKKAKP